MSFDPKNVSTKHLYSLRIKYVAQAEHKESVVRRHEPGGPYHTRALREASELRRRIGLIDAELERRNGQATA